MVFHFGFVKAWVEGAEDAEYLSTHYGAGAYSELSAAVAAAAAVAPPGFGYALLSCLVHCFRCVRACGRATPDPRPQSGVCPVPLMWRVCLGCVCGSCLEGGCVVHGLAYARAACIAACCCAEPSCGASAARDPRRVVGVSEESRLWTAPMVHSSDGRTWSPAQLAYEWLHGGVIAVLDPPWSWPPRPGCAL